jgi:hypothetical protein
VSTYKIVVKGVECGCEFTRNGRDQEFMTHLCSEHKHEFDARHAAAVLSCSHVNKDLTE